MKLFTKRKAKTFFDFIEVLFISATVSLVVFLAVGQLLVVSGDSMLPNFKDKEQLISERVTLKFQDLKRGDVIIFRDPEAHEKLIIKRVVGLPGESIKISEGEVFINGKALEEPYLDKNTKTNGSGKLPENSQVKIPSDSYAVFGDNRSNSLDSRKWGFIKKSEIAGRSLLVYYPITSLRLTRN